MFKKKGISPLIATVLIIGFTVALAAIIMTWGTSFSRGMQQSSEETADIKMICTRDVVFKVDAACWVGVNKLKVTAVNDGSKALQEVAARVYVSATDLESNISLAGISPFDKEVFEIDLDDPAANGVIGDGKLITQVELIPIIDVKGRKITCAETIAAFGDVLGEPLDECV